MGEKAKKILKTGAYVVGSVAVVAVVGAAFVGGGEICRALYYDPENWMHSIFQSSMLGYDHMFNLGWAA